MAAEAVPHAELQLSDLSLALLVRCLRALDPVDIVAVSQTCTQLRSAALDDSQLWPPIFKSKWNFPSTNDDNDNTPRRMGWLCREYRSRERLLSILPTLPTKSKACEWSTVSSIAGRVSSLLFTGQSVDVTCATLAAHGAGSSLPQACITIAERIGSGDTSKEVERAFTAVATALSAWLQCMHDDSPDRHSDLAALATALHRILQPEALTDGWRVSVASLLVTVQRSLWFTGSPGATTGQQALRTGLTDALPVGGRLPFRRRKSHPHSQNLRTLGGSWKGLRFGCGCHDGPEVTMSLTLTIAGDDRSISAVGKDSLGSYTAEGAVTVGNEDRAAVGARLGLIHFKLTYREYGGIPAALVHLRSQRSQCLLFFGHITPLGISGCWSHAPPGTTEAQQAAITSSSGTFTLWPRTGK